MRVEHPDWAIAALCATQYGLVAYPQLRDLGLSRSAISRRLKRGHLHPIHRGVYAVGHPGIGARARWLAATMAIGAGALLSHLDAAALWRLLPGRAGSIHVTVPADSGCRSRAGIHVHRARIDARDRCRREGIAVTSPERTLIDVASTLPRRRLERAVDEAAFLYRLDERKLANALARSGRRPGAAALAVVLADHVPGSTRTRSELEERFLELCDTHGLGRPRVNVIVAGLEVDFLFAAARLIVETDGYASHGRNRSFERDHERDAHLRDAGYEVSRFTYRQVTERADWVAGSVANDLARRNPKTR